MGYLIIFFTAWITLFFVFNKEVNSKYAEDYVTVVMGSLMVSMIVTFGSFIITLPFVQRDIKTYTVDIYSAGSKDKINGSFVFGTGQIKSEEWFSVFVKRGHGKQKYTFPSAGVTIIETDTQKPHITVQYKAVRDTLYNKMFDFVGDCGYTVTELVVPTGSVAASFNID